MSMAAIFRHFSLHVFLVLSIIPICTSNFTIFKNGSIVHRSHRDEQPLVWGSRVGSKPITRNVGVSSYFPKTRTESYSGTINSKHPFVPSSVLNDAVVGTSFNLSFPAEPGSYDVLLAFVQGYDCTMGSRVFHVSINNKRILNNFDIFAKVGCKKAYIVQCSNLIVHPTSSTKLFVELQAVSGKAALSYIRISPSVKKCLSGGSTSSSNSHYSHSVPGVYPPDGGAYIDSANKGFVSVTIDGSGSHTHAQIKGRDARIISYRWLLSDGRVLSTAKKFTHKFPIGTTTLQLVVQDEGCSTNKAETAITVTGRKGNGASCYYYLDPPSILRAGTLYKNPVPLFSEIQRSLTLKFPSSFWKKRFVMRCLFLLQLNKKGSQISVETSVAGLAHVYNRGKRIIDSSSGRPFTTFKASGGSHLFELLYFQKAGTANSGLKFKLNGVVPWKVYYDHSTVLPILKTISPSSGRTGGGTVVKLSGYGLNPPVTILFGNQKIFVLQNEGSFNQVSVKSPQVRQQMTVDVQIQRSKKIASNLLSFNYGDACDDVAFETRFITSSGNTRLALNQPTSIVTSADGSLYIGSRIGEIIVLKYDSATLKITMKCSSGIFVDQKWKNEWGRPLQRSILGITLDPRDVVPRPYVSVSTLFWEKWGLIKNGLQSGGWANGAIERFKSASPSTRSRFPGRCLEHDKTIARNLPVGNGDHAINELVFTLEGDLLVGVGANTNMGLPHVALGGLWETFFSGSVIILRLSKGSSFNGVVPFSTFSNMRTTRPKGGYFDVDVYATGFRNMFSLSMTRSGKIFGVDMGPNCDFGNAAAICTEYEEPEAAKRSPKSQAFIGGKAIVDDRFCRNKFSASRGDKFVEIKKGKFYGHPNLQRARLRNTPGECAYIDPETGKTAPPLKRNPPANYEPPIALIKSPRTGFREYGGNGFCGKLRESFIFANDGRHGTTGLTLSVNREALNDVFQISSGGGLRVDETIYGDLILPQYHSTRKSGIVVLRPKVRKTTTLEIINALPFRHGKRGGTIIRIGGTGFSNNLTVRVGRKPCTVVAVSPTVITCKVPAASRGGEVAPIEVHSNGVTKILSKAVLYMNV